MNSNKDYLSQEEIDALLKRTSEDDMLDTDSIDIQESTPYPDIASYLTMMEQDALGEIGNITFGSAATALSTLLGKKVEITTPTVSVVPRELLVNEFPTPHVAVHVNYIDGFKGINLLVIQSQDAQVIADLMLGGTGHVDGNAELNDIHISAVQEAMNQMMGSSATSMSTIFNRFVNISPPGIDIMNLPEGEGTGTLPNELVFIKISFRITIGDLIDSSIMQLLPIDFAKEMVSSLIGGDDEANHSTTEAAAPMADSAAVETGPTFEQPVSLPNVEPPVQQPPVAPPVQQPIQQPVHHQPPYQPPYQQPSQPATYGVPHQRNVNVQPVQYSSLPTGGAVQGEETNLNLLLDIPLKVTVELGRTKKLIKEILELSQGSIVELDKLAGEPVDILVNHKLIAKGEVVVIDENFGVRVTDIISQSDRIFKLQ